MLCAFPLYFPKFPAKHSNSTRTFPAHSRKMLLRKTQRRSRMIYTDVGFSTINAILSAQCHSGWEVYSMSKSVHIGPLSTLSFFWFYSISRFRVHIHKIFSKSLKNVWKYQILRVRRPRRYIFYPLQLYRH